MAEKKKKKADPKVGTGKKPKVVTDDYIRMKTLKTQLASSLPQSQMPKQPLQKLKINKPYARKIQILTVAEQRAKVMGKTKVVELFKKAKEQLKRKHENDKRKV